MTSPRRKKIKWEKWCDRHTAKWRKWIEEEMKEESRLFKIESAGYPTGVFKGFDTPTLDKIIGRVHDTITSEPSPYKEIAPGVFGVVEDSDKYEARYVGSVEGCHPDMEKFFSTNRVVGLSTK